MAKLINCECGYVARADSEDGVIELIREHMRTDHPQMLDQVTREDLQGWVQED
jgi:predicted small metal-binding protein